jgi:hypothetical protein
MNYLRMRQKLGCMQIFFAVYMKRRIRRIKHGI